jgi:hypothetical protein
MVVTGLRPPSHLLVAWLDPEILHQVFQMSMDLGVPLRKETTEEGVLREHETIDAGVFLSNSTGLISAVHLTSDGPYLSFQVSTENGFPLDTFSGATSTRHLLGQLENKLTHLFSLLNLLLTEEKQQQPERYSYLTKLSLTEGLLRQVYNSTPIPESNLVDCKLVQPDISIGWSGHLVLNL